MSTPMTPEDPTEISAHYGTGDLVARVENALREAGFAETGLIPWNSLAPLDQFHVGGAAATADLATRLNIAETDRLLDVGCGLGGPARQIASVHGCAVDGIDINPHFIALARRLTDRASLSGRVRHQVGDACRLPFAASSFDHVWTQHAVMNIADRATLYAGIFRVLRPGGRFAMHDIVTGDTAPLHFPVPWARNPAASFLLSPDATRQFLQEAGFTILDWTDATQVSMAWFQARASNALAMPDRLKPLALPLIMGNDFPAMTANLARNLHEGRARVLQAIVQRPH